jgi:hypothetical protein
MARLWRDQVNMQNNLIRGTYVTEAHCNPMREDDELLRELAVAAATATYQNLSIIGALAERHLVDQAKVADWAEFFARELENRTKGAPANLEHVRKVAARLRDYARQLHCTVQI